MGWFRKKLNDEVNDLIKKLGVSKKFLSEEWTWKDPKLKGLHQLEEIDLEIIRKIRKLHRLVKDNPKIYERIMLLSTELKKDLDNMIKLKNLSTSLSKEKLSLAKDIVSELQILLKEEIEEEGLIRGMTRKQAEKLGIEVESFYCVVGPNSLKRIMHGEGIWPMEEYRANLGIGVYTFDNFEAAKTYRNMRRENLREQGKNPNLKIIQISFSKFSLSEFDRQGKHKDLRLIPDEERETWFDKYSAYGDKNVTKEGKIKKKHLHDYFHVISRRAHGVEHYFRPECLEEAAIELAA